MLKCIAINTCVNLCILSGNQKLRIEGNDNVDVLVLEDVAENQTWSFSNLYWDVSSTNTSDIVENQEEGSFAFIQSTSTSDDDEQGVKQRVQFQNKNTSGMLVRVAFYYNLLPSCLTRYATSNSDMCDISTRSSS